MKMKLVCSFLLFIVCVNALEQFDPSRLLFIDKVVHSTGTNYLFRSNAPFKRVESGCTFAYGEIVSRMREVCAEKTPNNTCGDVLPDFLPIVDVSLLHGEPLGSERSDVKCEEDFFKDFPHLGRAVNWPIHGDELPPKDLAEPLLKKMAETLDVWQRDKLPRRIPELRHWLETPPVNGSVAYLVHCEAGHDRTGEFSGSYMLNYGAMEKKWTYDEALAYDNNCFGHLSPIGHCETLGMQWYCLWLKYKHGVEDDCGLKH